jgi:hypothetical protein
MAKRIPLSFKENDRDMKLYSYIMKESDRSCFIKKAIEFYIDHLNSKSVIANNQMNFENEDEGIGEIMGL